MKRKNKISLVFIILTIIALLVFIKVFNRPLHSLTSDFYHPFFSPIQKVENLSAKQALMLQSKTELVEELLKLQQVNEQFSAELNVQQEIKQENANLKDLLAFKSTPGYKCVFAKIFRRDPDFWNQSFSINKGSKDGILAGCAVLCRIPKGKNKKYVFAVAGRISKVSQNDAQVETIISKNCRLSVILKNNKAAGILEGGTIKNGKPETIVTMLPAFKKYMAGETVVTSGLSKDTTPPLLFVGKIADSNGAPDVQIVTNLFAKARVIPAVDFDNLRYLVVLVPKQTQNLAGE